MLRFSRFGLQLSRLLLMLKQALRPEGVYKCSAKCLQLRRRPIPITKRPTHRFLSLGLLLLKSRSLMPLVLISSF